MSDAFYRNPTLSTKRQLLSEKMTLFRKSLGEAYSHERQTPFWLKLCAHLEEFATALGGRADHAIDLRIPKDILRQLLTFSLKWEDATDLHNPNRTVAVWVRDDRKDQTLTFAGKRAAISELSRHIPEVQEAIRHLIAPWQQALCALPLSDYRPAPVNGGTRALPTSAQEWIDKLQRLQQIAEKMPSRPRWQVLCLPHPIFDGEIVLELLVKFVYTPFPETDALSLTERSDLYVVNALTRIRTMQVDIAMQFADWWELEAFEVEQGSWYREDDECVIVTKCQRTSDLNRHNTVAACRFPGFRLGCSVGDGTTHLLCPAGVSVYFPKNAQHHPPPISKVPLYPCTCPLCLDEKFEPLGRSR